MRRKRMALALCLCFIPASGSCLSGQFVEDLADSPSQTGIGRESLQGALCALGGYGGARLMESGGAKEMWWFPAVGLSLGFILLHVPFFTDGGRNRDLAIRETAFEVGGAFLGGSLAVIKF